MTDTNGTGLVQAGERQPASSDEAKNYFEQYGEKTQRSAFVGERLKFSKGDFLAGKDETEVPAGTQLACCMDSFLIGWIKWVDNQPEEQIMGLLVEGHVPAKRNTLGDNDQSLWEVDEQSGKPRDPWQMTNQVLFKKKGKQRKDGDDGLYTFVTSSYGGISNLGKLCKAYGQAMRQHPDEYPVVELGVEKYKHSNPTLGFIKNPTFTIVGWEKKSLFAEPAPAAAQVEDQSAPAARGGRRRSASA